MLCTLTTAKKMVINLFSHSENIPDETAYLGVLLSFTCYTDSLLQSGSESVPLVIRMRQGTLGSQLEMG